MSVTSTGLPRFNMPLELGMTITWASLHPKGHTWFVWESEPYRLQRSASDLNGTDPYIHFGTAEGVLSELRNAFRRDPAPSVPQMLVAYFLVISTLDSILMRNATRNPYSRSVFLDLCSLSRSLGDFYPPAKPAI